MSNTYNPRRTDYDCVWNSYDWGLVNDVQPAIKLMKKPITRGSLGKDLVLGHFVVGLEGQVKMQIPDIQASVILEACPWISANQYGMPNAIAPNTYQWAQLLTLHPRDMGATTTEDLNFVKAVPTTLFDMKRTGGDEDDKNGWELAFDLYPDFSKLTAGTPEVVYFFLGPVPESY